MPRPYRGAAEGLLFVFFDRISPRRVTSGRWATPRLLL
jgi:hypothetical protein